MDEDFPDIYNTIKEWIPGKKDKKLSIIFTKELSKAVQEMIPFCDGKEEHEKSILLTFKEKIIELFAQNEQVSMTKKVENNTGVSDVEFTITPSVLSSLILDAECFIHKDKLFFTSESITYVVGL